MAEYKKENKNELNKFLQYYLSNISSKNLEFEIRFGTKGKKFIKNDIDNIIKKLLSEGFVIQRNNEYTLKINSEFVHSSGQVRQNSNIRTEIIGIHNIRKYCKSNVLSEFITHKFLRKRRERLENMSNPFDVKKYNLRYSIEEEEELSPQNGDIQTLVSTWSDHKKSFRLINRLELEHPDYPFRIDISTVKTSKKLKNHSYEFTYTIEESNVFQNNIIYEVEIELLNEKVKQKVFDLLDEEKDKLKILKYYEKMLKMGIRYILSGIQRTNFPIDHYEMTNVLQSYLNLVGIPLRDYNRVYASDFIGPSSVTLQKINLIEDENQKIPTVLKNYTVTEKADGLRKMLYISKNGKIYLISMNMNIEFTGAICKNSNLFNSLFDGEHVLYGKTKQVINLYLCFDAYFIQGKDVRAEPFIENTIDEKKVYRLILAIKSFDNLKLEYVSPKYNYNMKMDVKDFILTNSDPEKSISIFEICKVMIEREKDKYYVYETDGLIFTPQLLGVGMTNEKDKPKQYKKTWHHSFKWKPPEFNTIDFLIQIEKNGPNEIIKTKQSDGVNMGKYDSISYKTLYLKVAYTMEDDGYINPLLDIIEGNVEERIQEDRKNERGIKIRKPGKFYPTNPYDNTAHICNIELKMTNSGEKELITEEGDLIEDNTVVEFKYVKENERYWKWVPLRVRYDKTNNTDFGNAYMTANNNWQSIHNPITEEILSTGQKLYIDSSDDDVYYNKRDDLESNTDKMKIFHNTFVKRILIQSYSNEEKILMDFAVGKAGDFPKWIHSKLKFVFGVDLSRDNIENKLDGACARYLNYKKRRYKKMPQVMFLQADSSKDLLQRKAYFDERSLNIQHAILGIGSKDKKIIGKGVYDLYGIASNMFDITSIQFALHYMFRDLNSLHTFMKNVSNFTKVGGHFIGTCFDGKRIFQYLQSVEKGEPKNIMVGDRKINSIIKFYDQEEFPDNSSCVGYTISVYQESINKYINEYLVNFDYLIQIMESYGFKVAQNPFTKSKNGIGGFEELFNLLLASKKQNEEYKEIKNMTEQEKTISFMNNYFIFMKTTEVDVESVYNMYVNKYTEKQVVE